MACEGVVSLVCVPGIVPSGSEIVSVIVLCVPIFPLGNLMLSLGSVIGWWLEWLRSCIAVGG